MPKSGQRTRAPGFREVRVVRQRVLGKGARTWRIAICRHLADDDIVVLWANRDKQFGGTRLELYRGTDAAAARAAAQARYEKALGAGYAPIDDERGHGFVDETRGASRRLSLRDTLGARRTARVA